MADTPFMDEERHAELARQQALWLAQGAPRPTLPVDQEVTPQQLADERFAKSPFGAIDRTLKAGTDWIKGRVKKRTAPFEAVQRRDEETSSGINPMGLPQSLPDPVELIPTMLMEGGRTANRWLYGTKDTSQLRNEDMLGPLGMGAMAAPFAAAKHGISLGSAGGRAASQAPFTRQVDDLGYYSKLDEVLGSLKPTDTVTAETLAKRGVKAAEIEARGLSPFLADGKGAKVSDLLAGAQPVQLKESRYAPMDAVDERSLDEFGNTYDSITSAQQRQLDEMMGGAAPRGEPKWRDYATDGGNPTYHEGVLHLPTQLSQYDAYRDSLHKKYAEQHGGGHGNWPMTAEERAKLDRLQETAYAEAEGIKAPFRQHHYPDEPNAIAHYRASLQPTEGGGKAYLIDELQSDWGQKIRDGGARDEAKIAELRTRLEAQTKLADDYILGEPATLVQKAYPGDFPYPAVTVPNVTRYLERLARDNAMPGDLREAASAHRLEIDKLTSPMRLMDSELRTAEAATPANPFVANSEQWMTTALRRMMRNAAEAEADGIAITPGAVHNERFGLEKHVDELRYEPDSQTLSGMRGGRQIIDEQVPPEKLGDYVGKEVAEKLTAPGWGGQWQSVGDMKLGGEGMKYAYDRMLPKLLGKELSRLDPSIKYGQQHLSPYDKPNEPSWYLGNGEEPMPFHHFPLTPKAREEIMKGLPMFSNPGTEQLLEAMRAQQQLQSPFSQDE